MYVLLFIIYLEYVCIVQCFRKKLVNMVEDGFAQCIKGCVIIKQGVIYCFLKSV